MRTRLEVRGGFAALGSAGASVVAASLLIGVSVGAICWAAESAILSSMRSSRAEDVSTSLLAARNLIAEQERRASREASQLAGRDDLQSALVRRDVSPLVAFSRTHPRVGFALANGQLVGGAALAGPGATIAVYSHGRYAGRVVVATPPDAALLANARKASPRTPLLYVVDGT